MVDTTKAQEATDRYGWAESDEERAKAVLAFMQAVTADIGSIGRALQQDRPEPAENSIISKEELAALDALHDDMDLLAMDADEPAESEEQYAICPNCTHQFVCNDPQPAAPSEHEAPAEERCKCGHEKLAHFGLTDNAMKHCAHNDCPCEKYEPAAPEQEAPAEYRDPPAGITRKPAILSRAMDEEPDCTPLAPLPAEEPGGEETESDRLSVAYTAGAMSRDAEIDALKQEVERLEDLAEGRKVMFKYERRKREQAQQERDTLRNLSLSLGNEKEVVEKQRDGWMERHELVSAQKKIVEAERDQFATEAHRQGWDDCVEAIGRNPFMLPLDELIYPGPKEDEDDYDYAADDRAYDEARERKL